MRLPDHNPTTVLIAVTVPLAAMIVGVWVARRGLRGGRINDHPVCRRCGYDLFGLSSAAGACPECGSDLSGDGAVGVGGRRPRRALVYTRAGLVVASAVALAFWGRTTYRVYSMDANKPTWWLMRQIASAVPAVRDAAVTELLRRLPNGRLTAEQRDRVVERALALQGDESVAWWPAWGEFVEDVHAGGQLDDARWQRYLRQGVPLAVAEYRKIVRRGENLPLHIRQGPARVGARPRYLMDYTVHAEVNGAPVRTIAGSGRMMMPIGPQWPVPGRPAEHRQDQVMLRGSAAEGLPDGPHTLAVEFRVKVCGLQMEALNRPLGEFKIAKRVDWTLVPSDLTTVEMVQDPAAVEDVRNRLGVRSVAYDTDRRNVTIVFAAPGITMPVAGDVLLRCDGGEWAVGNVVLRPPDGAGTVHGFTVLYLDAGKADVVVRASADAAVKTPDLTRVVGGEWVIEGAPLQRKAGLIPRARRAGTRPVEISR